SSARPPSAADAVLPLPEVRLELRGGNRAAAYPLTDVDFLIGSVPGCDLRVPGVELPPVLCLIACQPGGVTLRNLAPTQPVLVNGQPAANTPLADGDRIAVGAVELVVHLHPAAGTDSPAARALAAAKQQFQEQVARFQAEVLRFK